MDNGINPPLKAKLHLPSLLLLPALGLIYLPLLLLGADYRSGDLGDCTIPLLTWDAAYWSQAGNPAVAGPSPWNPYVLGGRPGIVDGGVYSALYPPTAWFLWYYAGRGYPDILKSPFFALSSVGHCLWAAAGMFMLLRVLRRSRAAALLGALVFAGGGFFATRLFVGQYPHVSSAAWTPWVYAAAWLLFRRRQPRYAVGLGLALALQLLAGLPQFSLVTLCGLPLLWLPWRWRRPRAVALAAGLTRLLLAAAIAVICTVSVTLPLGELLLHSQRRAGLEAVTLTQDVLAPARLTTLWLPLTTADDAFVPGFSETTLFIGWSPWLLLLAAVAAGLWRRRATWRWLLLGGLGLLLAAGAHLPFYPLLWRVVPGLAMIRSPGRWLLFTALALAVLTGYAYDRVRRRWPAARATLRWAPLLLVLELAWFPWLLLTLPMHYVGVPQWSRPDNPVINFLHRRQDPAGGRMAALADFTQLNEALAHRVESLNGYLGVVPGRFYDLLRLHDPRITRATPLYLFRPDNPAFRLLNVRHIVTRLDLDGQDTRWLPPLFTEGEAKVYALPWPAPRAWIPRAYRACRDEAEVLRLLAQPDFDPQALATGVGGDDYALAAGDSISVSVAVGGDGRLARTDSPRPAVLVFSEHYLPGWSVTVDGRAAGYFPVDHALIGIAIPAGRHAVELKYPERAPQRALAAAAGLPLLLLLGFLARRLTTAARR